jgi:hypothetical protein
VITTELSPFILLGMGIDVIFILGKAYDVIMCEYEQAG